MAVTLEAGVGDLAGRDLERGEQRGGAVTDVVVGLSSQARRPPSAGRRVRPRAWTWLFSSTQRTTAFSGGCMYSPTTSRTFASSSGSVLNLKVSTRQGCRFHLFQIRAMVACPSQSSRPSSREDQWVTPSHSAASPAWPPRPAASSICLARPDAADHRTCPCRPRDSAPATRSPSGGTPRPAGDLGVGHTLAGQQHDPRPPREPRRGSPSTAPTGATSTCPCPAPQAVPLPTSPQDLKLRPSMQLRDGPLAVRSTLAATPQSARERINPVSI